MNRIKYWNRIFNTYLLPTTSQLSFWHGIPELNTIPDLDNPEPYYMKFHYKANYDGHFDEHGIPMSDYHGNIGLQYNPIAIAQYGLENYNLFLETSIETRLNNFIHVADWLVKNLEPNSFNIPVWNHYFDFEYRDTLKSPWYSGLAQGLSISVLLRAYQKTNKEKYFNTFYDAWKSMITSVDEGGVIFVDKNQNYWIEEYIVKPPTHILNGFIWALWGVYDTWKILNNNNASVFYHKLHIVLLEILSKLSGNYFFKEISEKWKKFQTSNTNKYRSQLHKSIFKILYY